MTNSRGYFTLLLSVAVIAAGAGIAAAQECVGVTVTPGETVPPIPWYGGPGGFTVNNANQCFWKVTEVEAEGGWITLQHYEWKNNGPDEVTYTVSGNGGIARTGKIYVDGSPVHTVVQEAMPCGIFRSANSLTGSDLVYVANTACDRVAQIDNGAAPGWSAVYTEDPSTYEGLVFGPDGLLYALDPNPARPIIRRFDPALGVPEDVHTAGAPTQPRLAEFNHRGDLIVVDDSISGIWVFPNQNEIGQSLTFGPADVIDSSSSVASFTDIATTAAGDLLAADAGGEVRVFEFDPVGGGYGSPSVIATGLGSAAAIARSADGTVFVGAGNTIHQLEFDADWYLLSQSFCSNGFPATKTIQDIEMSANDTLYVTTTAAGFGELWEIPYYDEGTHSFGCATDPTLLATFTSDESGGTPLVAVAVPFTSRAGKLLIDGDPGFPAGLTANTQLFNFFDSVYEFRPHSAAPDCTVAVTAREFSPEFVQGLIAGGGVAATRPITFWGDNGRALGYQYGQTSDETTCDPEAGLFFEHAINAFYAGFNPQILRCHDNLDPTTCELITFESYFPGFGFFPRDGRFGGFTPDFSYAFLVDAASADTRYDGVFCGFQSPLINSTNPNDPNLPVYNTGSAVPIKFTVAEVSYSCDLDGDPNCQLTCDPEDPDCIVAEPIWSCQNGPYVTENLTAVLSLARVDPDFDPIDNLDIGGGGSAVSGRIVFSNPNNKNKPFALQVNLSEGGVNLDPGTYQAVVNDDSVESNGAPYYYFPTQETFFKVR